jgi:hypothetical protein
MGALRYHITRIHSPINTKEKKKEWTTIQLFARNKKFPQNLLEKLNRQMKQKITYDQTEERNKKLE